VWRQSELPAGVLTSDNLSAFPPSHTQSPTFKEGRGGSTTDVLPKQMGRLYIITKGALINQVSDSYLQSSVLDVKPSNRCPQKHAWDITITYLYTLLCNGFGGCGGGAPDTHPCHPETCTCAFICGRFKDLPRYHYKTKQKMLNRFLYV